MLETRFRFDVITKCQLHSLCDRPPPHHHQQYSIRGRDAEVPVEPTWAKSLPSNQLFYRAIKETATAGKPSQQLVMDTDYRQTGDTEDYSVGCGGRGMDHLSPSSVPDA